MDDLGGSIEAAAAQELVRLLVSGVGAAAKKVPQLWRRSGEAKQQVMTEELENSATALSQAEDPQQQQAKQQERWETHLRMLLLEDGDARADLEALLPELRSAASSVGSSNVHVGGTIQAADGGIAIGGITGGSVSVGGYHGDLQDPHRPGREQG